MFCVPPNGDVASIHRVPSGFPLEADAEAVGVGEVELLHAVPGDMRRVEGQAFFDEELVGGVYIWATDVEAGVAVGGDAGWVWGFRALAVVVGGVEHDFSVVAVPEQAPAKLVGGTERRVFGEGEAEDVAVEVDRGGHVEDFEVGTSAAHVDWHDYSPEIEE